MKLRKIIIATALLMLSSASFADNGGAMSQGGTYVGLAGGWGTVAIDDQAMSWLQGFHDVTGTSTQSGGFSGRVYLGYLMSLNTSSQWLFGPEIGYSYYQNSTYTANFTTTSIPVQNITQSAYGIDMLFNATYMLSNTFNIAVKPGFQYAFEKFSVPFVVTSDETILGSSSMSTSSILPEINVEANWQVLSNKPLFLGASYQYVWGNSRNNLDDFFNAGHISASSRDMFALNLEYLFN